MLSLIDPELWNVLFAIAGSLIGYFLRRHQLPGLPDGLGEIVQSMLDRKKQTDANATLARLLEEIQRPSTRSGG